MDCTEGQKFDRYPWQTKGTNRFLGSGSNVSIFHFFVVLPNTVLPPLLLLLLHFHRCQKRWIMSFGQGQVRLGHPIIIPLKRSRFPLAASWILLQERGALGNEFIYMYICKYVRTYVRICILFWLIYPQNGSIMSVADHEVTFRRGRLPSDPFSPGPASGFDGGRSDTHT